MRENIKVLELDKYETPLTRQKKKDLFQGA